MPAPVADGGSAPRRQIGVSSSGGGASARRRELDPHALDAVDERRLEHVGRPRDVDVGQAVQQLVEHHLDLAPGEVRAQAEVRAARPEAEVVVRRARGVETVGIAPERLVAVRRVVPEDDLVAGADRLPAELRVVRRRAPEVDHRRGPAHDLLDRGRRDALEVGHPPRALGGEVGERPHAVADRVARRLVAGDHEEDEERPELLAGEALPVDLGLDERGGDVLACARAPVLRGRLRVLEGLERRCDQLVAAARVLRIADAEDDVRELEDAPVVRRGDAHHVADDAERERRRHLLDEIARPLGGHRVDDPARLRAHGLFDLPDGARREPGAHQLSELRVPRGVHVDHRAEELVQLGRLVGDADAVAGDEALGVHARPHDVRVARHRPEARPLRDARELALLVERHRALGAQLREHALAVRAEPERRVAEPHVVQREVGGERRHCAVNPPSATISAPVTYDDSSDARNSATCAISRGWAIRPSGIESSNDFRLAGSLRYGACIGVSVMPGWMMLQRTFWRANWMAIDLVSEMRAPLAAVYESCATVKPASAETEPTLMIEPPPERIRWGMPCFITRNGPFRLIACTRSQSASLVSRTDLSLSFQSTPAWL